MNITNRLKKIEKHIKPETKKSESDWDLSKLSNKELERLLFLVDDHELTAEEQQELNEYYLKCRIEGDGIEHKKQNRQG